MQSGYWVDEGGHINCIDRKGHVFKARPANIGVEKHLYSKFNLDGTRDTQIETWLANHVDSPFDSAFKEIFDFSKIQRHRYKGDNGLHIVLKDIGYEMGDYIEELSITPERKKVLSNYIAGLLVRSPAYLQKLTDFHTIQASTAYNYALDNICLLYTSPSPRDRG